MSVHTHVHIRTRSDTRADTHSYSYIHTQRQATTCNLVNHKYAGISCQLSLMHSLAFPPSRPPPTTHRFSSEAVAYFLDLSRICNDRYLTRLLDIIRTSVAEPLLQQLLNSEERLLPIIATGCPSAGNVLGIPPTPAPGVGVCVCVCMCVCVCFFGWGGVHASVCVYVRGRGVKLGWRGE